MATSVVTHLTVVGSGQSFLRACTTYANHFSPRLGSSDGFESFHSVVARSLGGLNVLLSGEIHCIAGMTFASVL